MTKLAAPHPLHPVEIDAWVDEVGPVLAALRRRTAPPSEGQRRWMAEQVAVGRSALTVLEAEAFDAEDRQLPLESILWAHTRVSALLEASASLLAPGAPAVPLAA